MNALYENICWDKVKYVGFDLDGTLYDEFNFIIQPYNEISKLFKDSNVIFSYMCEKWLDKGSSYSYIFSETYDLYSNLLLINKDKKYFVNLCLELYRHCIPFLILSERTRQILMSYNSKYVVFLVTDGNPILQEKKFDSLGLISYFTKKNVFFTGRNKSLYEKPKIESLLHLDIDPHKAVFFGDREVDRDYALNTGMQFQLVYNMHPL